MSPWRRCQTTRSSIVATNTRLPICASLLTWSRGMPQSSPRPRASPSSAPAVKRPCPRRLPTRKPPTPSCVVTAPRSSSAFRAASRLIVLPPPSWVPCVPPKIAFRRAIAALACALCVPVACKRNAPPGSEQARGAQSLGTPARAPLDKNLLPAQEITWDYPQTELGPMRVVVMIPEREANARLPVLIALHGRGEALKGPELGARGWVDDYALPTTIERLHRPPITLDDLQGMADDERLARLNASLAKRPYQGLIVVCPYTPDALPADESIDKALPLARFVVETVLPRAYRETPAIGTPETTGIDGVSLGGRGALGIGLLRPKAFAVVASLQAALRS